MESDTRVHTLTHAGPNTHTGFGSTQAFPFITSVFPGILQYLIHLLCCPPCLHIFCLLHCLHFLRIKK